MGGGGTTRSVVGEQGPKYNALRVQTSTRGMVIPVVFGTNRVQGNLIWYGDFRYEGSVKTARWVDYGKGGGGRSYTLQYGNHYYSLAFAIGLCEGPIELGKIWSDKMKYGQAPEEFTLFAGNIPQARWPYLETYHPLESLNYPGLGYIGGSNVWLVDSDSLPSYNFEVKGLCRHIVNSLNLIKDSGWTEIGTPETFEQTVDGGIVVTHVVDSPASYGGGQTPFFSVEAGRTYEISFDYFIVSGAIRYLVTDGAGTQMAAWSFDTYNTTLGTWKSYKTTVSMVKSGSTAYARFYNASNLTTAEFRIRNVSISEASFDGDPRKIIETIVSDPRIGLGVSMEMDLESYQKWCLASNLLISPAYSEQSLAIDVIKTILDHTFSTAIWHDGSILRAIPFADTQVTGGGYTFIPDITPKYDLDDNDFLSDGTEEPIEVSRKSPAECYNVVRIECMNRAADYNIESVDAMDQASIDLYCQRPADGIKAWDICDPAIARTLAQLKMQRSLYVRNEYRFRLGWRYCLLEPMDIVTLTDVALGMNKFPVRLKECDEDDDHNIMITAEDFPEGAGHAALYPKQQNLGYQTDFNADPGNINFPVIFIPPSTLWENADKPELWIATSGLSSVWGGCDIHVSHDGSSYSYIGTIIGGSKHGILSAPLLSGSDPDSVNKCSVDLSESQGGLLSGTQLDADNLATLSMILDGGLELISYQTATLTESHKYDLTYLRRGAKGTTISSHPSGSSFVRLDDNILKLSFDPLWLHTITYFKFCSFNIWRANRQSLADVEAYQFILQYPISDVMSGADSVGISNNVSNIIDSGGGADSISVSK